MDGTDCRVHATHAMDRELYSYKLYTAALRYEIAVCIHTGNIIRSNGSYNTGASNDLMIYRHTLKRFFDDMDFVVTDNGHQDYMCLHAQIVLKRI